jgi:hypothetical protein
METSAPKSASQGRNPTATPTTIPSNVANAAPPDTPSTYGSAKGLRNNTCIRQPDIASIEPTTHAAIARGSLSRHINSPCRLLESCIANSHSCHPIDTEPVALAKNMLPTDNSNNKIISDRRNVVGIILQD